MDITFLELHAREQWATEQRNAVNAHLPWSEDVIVLGSTIPECDNVVG